ncbi:MAG: tetratricopeptide repeat protein [Candidatus Protistobacter heckmanni]|nr:tetratricopeptide repeat protein [Candidatus Protistobacter heckmanni]
MPDALAVLDQALALDGAYAQAWLARGNVFRAKDQFPDALEGYERVRCAAARLCGSLGNIGVCLQDMGKYGERLEAYDQAISIQPDYARAWMNKSTVELLLGDFSSGWAHYECRWRTDSAEVYRHDGIPTLTDLRRVAGERILAWSEQGLGDTIQFNRYVRMLAEAGVEVVFEVQAALRGLFAGQMGTAMISMGEDPGRIDFQTPLLNLPRLFGTTESSVPGETLYLKAQPDVIAHWRQRLL